ncbi:hypothetical protein [Palaeococcus ferrophilus]|uniref:hypothetical protein n=1 Tax=Palaeococcus ferrophilus TaxID=83868 RepID=UPI00064EA85A|nr:hypothetical protein [Palaeococcus ferrophilus]
MRPRIRFSVLPFFLLLLLTYGTRFFVPSLLLALGFLSYAMGMLALLALVLFIVYYRAGGLYGMGLVALSLLFLESAEMDRKRAPGEHYLILLLAVFLALPLYYLVVGLAPLMPSLEVTMVAALMVVLLYLVSRLVVAEQTK